MHQQTVSLAYVQTSHESLWFKRGKTIETIALYNLILILMAFTLIQGHMSAKKQKLLR